MILLLLAALAGADEPDDWGDDELGFADGPDAAEATEGEDAAEITKPLRVGGTLRHDEVVWLEPASHDGAVAHLRTALEPFVAWRRGAIRVELGGHFEIDPRYALDPDLGEPTRRTYGWQVEPREAFVELTPHERWVVSVGRQVVALGEGVILTPLDVIAPRAARLPGLGEPEDLRLPVGMLRVAWFPGAHRLELIAVPERSWGHRSDPAGPYGVVDDLLRDAGTPLPDGTTLEWEHLPTGLSAREADLLLRWRHLGRGVDVSLVAGSVLDGVGVFEPTAPARGEPLPVTLAHRRATLLGGSLAASLADPLLVRAEVAAGVGRPVNVVDAEARAPGLGVSVVERTLITGMVGLRYTGLPRTTVDVEVQAGRFVDRPKRLLFPVDAEVAALRAHHHLLRERLELTFVGLLFGLDARYGYTARQEVTCELADGVHASLGALLVVPDGERGPLYGLDAHHQAFTRVRLDF